MSVVILPLPHTISWHEQGQLCYITLIQGPYFITKLSFVISCIYPPSHLWRSDVWLDLILQTSKQEVETDSCGLK